MPKPPTARLGIPRWESATRTASSMSPTSSPRSPASWSPRPSLSRVGLRGVVQVDVVAERENVNVAAAGVAERAKEPVVQAVV